MTDQAAKRIENKIDILGWIMLAIFVVLCVRACNDGSRLERIAVSLEAIAAQAQADAPTPDDTP